ncbi:carbohydrate ABC transporter substrate-binding protein (CUT1 family) [Glaciihabitans tibetensis]|uniref:Carbohydrate ABC transporter substrate-binding protein (CUT1 family) n=1 Tax=Glaciihabitans tibetensis TaxID=1266600 RepID=A0A2T0V5R6_9MICO|nr:extracellular solute-binding protein [Glaciihabitans tibetensis]PRY65418.1 carbohydrate ABC transporter substrate-binding protein (CUT1 family) [Glaciihabitans tibetensis]
MTTANHARLRRAFLPVIAGIGAGALLLTGCSGGSDGGNSSDGATEFTYLSLTENTAVADTLTTLSEGACAAENEALPLKVTNQPQASFDQQLQLLAGQDALPVIFAAGNTPQVAKDLNEAGQILNIGETFDELGVAENILPAASSTIESLYGEQIALPTEFNVEGLWFNKQILEQNGITPPTTWDELVDAAATLDAAGVQPFSASGEQGWPLTRLVGNYLFRTIGPDALQAVADGDAELTEAEYVEAAQAVADLGAEGYFGEGVGSIDYDTSINTFTSGQAAFLYMGSWVLSSFNDAETNQLGAENIGFIPFPEVEGGSGSSDQLAANVGVPLMVSESAYNDEVGAWLSCISENYGSVSLGDQGVLSGFTVNDDSIEVPPLTAELQAAIDASGDSVLWTEALFNAQATTTSQTNAAQLVTGAITPEEFMQLVQADLGN